MKEYLELAQLFEQHGRPTDYHAFSEHSDVLLLKIHLGHPLTCIFLCLLSQRCKPDKELLERLVRYKNENRLRDLEVAMIELATLGFVMNATIIHNLCAKAGKETSFLPSVQLLHIAKQAGLLNVENNPVSDEVFRLLSIKKISLYRKLIEKSALDIHVLQNTSFSYLPSDPTKINACVEIYAYAKLCQCTAILNMPNDKIDILALWGSSDVARLLKNLHETQRLTADSFLLACKSRNSHTSLIPILKLLERKALELTSFCRHILAYGKTFSNLETLYKLLVLIERGDFVPINEELIQSLIILDKKLDLIVYALTYLEQRAALTRSCFTWILEYHEGEQRKESAISTEPASKKPRSTLSYGLFSSKKTEEIPTVKMGPLLFALSEAHLLDDHSDWILSGDNRWIPECFTVSRAAFIQQLFQLGELNQHSLTLAREAHFDDACLTNLIALAKLHFPFPNALPRERVTDYLFCFTLLAPLSNAVPNTVSQFAFDQPVVLEKILLLLENKNKLTLDVILAVIEHCQPSKGFVRYYKEIVFCTLLHWPMTEIETMAASASSSEAVFTALQWLEKAGIDVSANSDTLFILPALYQALDPVLNAKIILALSTAHAFNRDTWALVCSVDAKRNASLPGMIQRLAAWGHCHLASLTLILSTKKYSIALEVFLLLTKEDLSVSTYWNALMQHSQPWLLCRGLVELKSRGLLMADYFSKIAVTKQPLLAVNALAKLLLAGIPLASCWDEMADAENPEECADMAIGSATPGKLGEDLPLELKTAVIQHAQPKLARQHLSMLWPLPHITTAHLLQILPREEARAIVQALVQLSELTSLNAALIALIIHNPAMLVPLKNYLSSGDSSQELLIPLCQTSSVKEAENYLEREQFIRQYPNVATLLRKCLTDASKHSHWMKALTLLASVNEINEMSITYLQQSNEPDVRAKMMVALKKSGLYSTTNLDRAIVRENQAAGVYKALHYLAEEGDLNALLFNFVMINSHYEVIKAAKHLTRVPHILFAHLNWLATNSSNGDDAVSIINHLHEANLLTRHWVEKISQQVEPSLEDINNQLDHIPSALLDDSLLEEIFTTEGICYTNDEENYYNPFEKFSTGDDNSLLTKEVIQVILKQSSGQSNTVYYSMSLLKKAGLFQPEIILLCTTHARTNAIITLSKAQQWNETTKAMILASRDPQEEAWLIACLVQQNKYSQTTARLLLLRLELIRSNKRASPYSGNNADCFSKVLKELFTKRPLLQENTLQCLLSTDIKWESMRAILELIKDDALTDDSVCLMAMSDQTYLHVYLNYIYYAFDEKECHFAELLKLCSYESYLNYPALLNVMEASVSYGARKKPLDTSNMQQLLSELWSLCQTGDQAAIHARIVSPTNASVARLGI